MITRQTSNSDVTWENRPLKAKTTTFIKSAAQGEDLLTLVE